MADSPGLGRVAVVDRGEVGRRVLRAIRELARAGKAGEAVALLAPSERGSPFAREADEVVAPEGSHEQGLRLARAGAAWLGPAASMLERAAFASACAKLGIVHLGWPAAALERLRGPAALEDLAAAAGLPLQKQAPGAGARLLEVAVARDAKGAARAVGVGDASLRAGDEAILVESPPPGLADPEDAAAREAALRAAGAAGIVGVCSVELVLDPDTRKLSLTGLSLLPRSAPAIEAAASVDLVRLAVGLAAGAPLDAPAAAPARRHGAAARVLPRDPELTAQAAPGRLERLRLPADPDVRAEAAAEEGDPIAAALPIVTLIAHGAERADVLARLGQALEDSDVLVSGSGTNRAFLVALLARPELRQGEAGVGLLPRLAAGGERIVQPRPEVALVAAAIEAYEAQLDLERARFLAEAKRGRPQVGPSSGRGVELRYAGQRHRLDVRQTGPDAFRVASGKSVAAVRVERLGRAERRLVLGDRPARVLTTSDGMSLLVEVDGVPHPILREPTGLVVSPMPAVVVAIPVQPGQEVAAGEPVARIESMKVELLVNAPEAGVVREVMAVANTQVDAGAPLVRLEAIGDRPTGAAPIALSGGAIPEPTDPQERYLAALSDLRGLLLGFDVAPAEARTLAAALRERGAAVRGDDPAVLRAEEASLAAFADVLSLFSRSRGVSAPADARPPLEELWHYLHEPEQRGAGLTPAFVAMLRRALSHYQVSLDAPGHALELALLRVQKSHERADGAVPLVIAILERRMAGAEPPGFGGPDGRALLDRLAGVGQERFPPVADLARELRYRRFDRPAFEKIRSQIYADATADLARLPAAEPKEREDIVKRLVACPQPLVTTLVGRMGEGDAALRARLVEVLLRRYYRIRQLGPVVPRELDGVVCATVDYPLDGVPIRIVAGAARAGDAPRLARAVARLSAEAPPNADVAADLFLWDDDREPLGDDARAGALRRALVEAGFTRPMRRATAVVALRGRGLGRQSSQQHLTFHGDDWAEDPRYRGVHPMLFGRMQLGRLAQFELERLPSEEDLYLYRGVARTNPKDERLFAVAEIRDLTPVRDAHGHVVQLPHLERKLHEALAGMRRFQAARPPHQRLEWNRVLLTVEPPLLLAREEIRALADRLLPSTEGLGLEMLAIAARVPDPDAGDLTDVLIRVVTTGQGLSIRYDEPTERPLEPLAEYQQRVVALRRRGITHPFELAKMLAPPAGAETDVPPGEFIEHDLDAAGALVPVSRPPGQNSANMVVGVVRNFTDRYPEGMTRVVLLGDPSRAMGSLAEAECRRIDAAIRLAEKLKVPLEWFAVSAGAKISMESGTENMDWISRVLRTIIEFTQRGGEINVVVTGINVGAQPYWNAESTMLMHTRGILVMTPGSAMVLTGKEALEFSGSVSAEDNQGIGGYDRIMGPNGQAQYRAGSLAEGIRILLAHYDHTYVAPGERFPRRARSTDPVDRDVRSFPHGPEGGAGFATIGDVFSREMNPDRKKPFDIRRVMASAIDQDHPPLERWRDLRGGETAVVWDAHLGGWPVCLIGIESRPLPRLEFVPADGPTLWSAGTLFPQSSKKIARAVNGASGIRPVVVLANLSGFDGSPESMRRLQLEYGAEIGRAVVNFQGPFVFCVVSRYHGGAFVVFSKALREDIEVVAVEGARASVIGGAPAAAVVFAREVETRARKDPRVVEAEKAAAAGGAAKARLGDVLTQVRSEKVGKVAEEFDAIHTVERALQVGSLDAIIAPRDLRPWLVGAVERGIAKHAPR
jgi:acetyl/propionyl-CoA carboxylase alpha subunit/acetyl-CoA carboxylase carboxyltransferase component